MDKDSYTRRELGEALLRLLGQKELAEISVSELCAEACVSRSSFYRSFDGMEDIQSQTVVHRLGSKPMNAQRPEIGFQSDVCANRYLGLGFGTGSGADVYPQVRGFEQKTIAGTIILQRIKTHYTDYGISSRNQTTHQLAN